jgi:NAD(P)-dependent dehydrogenase (short-subunit alcohol dehydrogenase family)
MELADKVAVVTGGGNGIGRALCRRYAAEGARGVVVVDRDADAVRAVADELGDRALGLTADVAVEADVVNVVEQAEGRFGPVDLFCSNAGIGGGGGIEAPDDIWHDVWAINVSTRREQCCLR